MKPLKSEIQNTNDLIELGRASVQIIHDLKNQINGLKLYATFLRKRFAGSDRPADERETLAKIIDGLERAAADMTLLVRFGRPLELRRQSLDLPKALAAATEDASNAAPDGDYQGAFDISALTEALRSIHQVARVNHTHDGSPEVRLRREETEGAPSAVIEWRGWRSRKDGDPFNSFACGDDLRLALAAKIIRAHDGTIEQTDAHTLRVRLPLQKM